MKHFRNILLPFSWIYAMVMWIRNVCYDKGLFTINKVNVPVISVGNITTGGTGKTPFVEYLVRYLIHHKKKVAVISRGYKRGTKGTFIASDCKNIFGSAAIAGDEVYQMAKKFPHAIVIADEIRSRGARIAVDTYGADVIVLDDGFQHRSLARNLDIVMIDGETMLDGMLLLPAGNRREPLSALQRAHILMVSRSSDAELRKEEFRRYSKAPVAKVEFRPKSFVHVASLRSYSNGEFNNQTCIAFCGIGNPESFRRALEKLGLKIVDVVIYPDHHSFTSSDLKSLSDVFTKHRPAIMITTEKDAVRLVEHDLTGHPFSTSLYYLEIEAEIIEGEIMLHQLIDATVKTEGLWS